jgi:hypothetical protein
MDWSDWDAHPQDHKAYGQMMVAKYGIDPKKLTQCSTCHR